MGILQRLFPAKTTITSATIKAEIDYSESEIARLNAEIGPKLATIATMTDAEHVKAEADVAANKRAIDRLDQRIAHLQSELPVVLAAEEAAAKATADAALRALAEACRKANEKEAAKLLAAYDEHASAIGGIIAKLKAMDGEREAINAELRTNAVCEPVRSYVAFTAPPPALKPPNSARRCHAGFTAIRVVPPTRRIRSISMKHRARTCGARPLAQMVSRSGVLLRFIITTVGRSSLSRCWRSAKSSSPEPEPNPVVTRTR
jgi:hypothetical protein